MIFLFLWLAVRVGGKREWPVWTPPAEMIRRQDPQQGKAAYELAEAFCEQSRLRIEELFDRLWTNTATADTPRRMPGSCIGRLLSLAFP